MLSILRKTTASLRKINRPTPTQPHDVIGDELSAWEFVNGTISDDDVCSFDGDEAFIDKLESKPEENEEEDTCDSRDVLLQSLSVSPSTAFPVVEVMMLQHTRDGDGCVDDDDDSDEVEDEEDEDDVYDDDEVDDELVPWKLKGRFGKQRIRKIGKKSGSKFSKSKKLPHYHNRPGCLYGKHGLGVQHSYI